MSDQLIESLNALETTLTRLGRNVVQLLQPGLSRKAIEERLAARGLPVVPDLSALYAWRNGTDTTTGAVLDDLHFVPGFYFLSLEDFLANYNAFIKSPRWQPSWLPILANGGGDFLVLDVSAGVATTVVRHFRVEQEDHPVEYMSLAAMVATFVTAYDRGIFFVDGEGYLDVDDLAYASLATDLNPCVLWWHE